MVQRFAMRLRDDDDERLHRLALRFSEKLCRVTPRGRAIKLALRALDENDVLCEQVVEQAVRIINGNAGVWGDVKAQA